MSLCYRCGKEGEVSECPYCGIRYCSEHMDPKEHNCIAYRGTSRFGGTVRKEYDPEHGEVYIEEIPLGSSSEPRRESNKMIIAIGMIVISISSIVLVSMFSGNQVLPAITPPEVDYDLHSVALAQVNVYRYRNDLPELEYRLSDVPQEWAFRMARTGRLEHNTDLPSSMGENVALRTERGQDPKIAIALMVQKMVTEDEEFGNANRDNILGDYEMVSIGVAVEGNTVYLVLNFS